MWKDFFEGLHRLKESKTDFVVATVVKVSGSTYRRPGARVLITREGVTTGLISGGCFESDLIERAKRVLETNQPAVATFDTTSPDDLLFGLGLGCTGIAHILLESFDPSSSAYLDFIERCVSQREQGVITTIFRVHEVPGAAVGSKILVQPNATKADKLQNPEVQELLTKESLAVLRNGESKVQTYQTGNGSVDALLEFIDLPLPLVIFGAGPDAVPLVRFAKELGWSVTVIDRRPAFARTDRFPSANSVILTEPEDLGTKIKLDSTQAAVVMNHNFEADLKFLKQLLISPVFYIGLLGPASKTDLLFQKLKEEGFTPTEEQLARLHSPVGLDVGAETPEEIALSILSEIQAVKSGYPGGFLKTRTGPIHKREI